MKPLPAELARQWSSDCRACGRRVVWAFDGAHDSPVAVDEDGVCGGEYALELMGDGSLKLRKVVAEASTLGFTLHRWHCTPESPKRPGPTTPPVRRLMPFGKHAGEYLADIPAGYLRWALENCDFRDPSLRAAIEEVVEEAG